MHARRLNMSSEYVIEGGTSLAADTSRDRSRAKRPIEAYIGTPVDRFLPRKCRAGQVPGR